MRSSSGSGTWEMPFRSHRVPLAGALPYPVSTQRWITTAGRSCETRGSNWGTSYLFAPHTTSDSKVQRPSTDRFTCFRFFRRSLGFRPRPSEPGGLAFHLYSAIPTLSRPAPHTRKELEKNGQPSQQTPVVLRANCGHREAWLSAQGSSEPSPGQTPAKSALLRPGKRGAMSCSSAPSSASVPGLILFGSSAKRHLGQGKRMYKS